MKFSQRFAISALTLAIGLLAQTAAQAVALTLPSGGSSFADTALPGTTNAARPELGGVVQEDVITPFSFAGVTGTVQNRVVRENGTGTLDFYWKVDVTSSDTGAGVGTFRLADFGYGNIQDADWRIDGLGTVGASAARVFNSSSYPAGDINFLLDGAVTAGGASRFFFLHTNATSYGLTAKYDLLTDGAQTLSGSFSTFAPAVPEPSTYALSLVGLLMTGVLMRRRRAQ